MKFSWAAIFQAIAAIGQIANVASSFFPTEKGKLIAATVVGATQFAVAQYQRWHNPDGTPAAMAYVEEKK